MTELKLSKSDLDWACSEGILSPNQANTLWNALESRSSGVTRFDLPHVAYYAGALVVISAMGWFMAEGWSAFGGGALTAIALSYAIVFSVVGAELWFRRDLKVPGGLLFVIAVCMTPLAVFGAERMAGMWPEGDTSVYAIDSTGRWLFMELGTVIAGLVTLRFVRFPFLTAPIALSLWLLSMDLVPFLLGQDGFSWAQRRHVAVWFGLAMLAGAYFVDRRTREDYAFWGYLFGLMAFWGGLSFAQRESELANFGYFIVNLLLMTLSVLLQRRVFILFGGLGVFVYFFHLAQEVFADSLLFPFALSLIGVLTMFGGVKFQRHEDQINSAIICSLPETLRRLLPTERMGGTSEKNRGED